MTVNKLHTDQCKACPFSGLQYMLSLLFGKPHDQSISHFACSLVPVVFYVKYIYGVVLLKLSQFKSVDG